MPRKPKKPQPQQEGNKPFDDLVDDSEAATEDDVGVDAAAPLPTKLRDWRDVEKFKEERMLRKAIGDQLDFDELDKPRAWRR